MPPPLQVFACSTIIYCHMIQIGSCRVTCSTLCPVCVECTKKLSASAFHTKRKLSRNMQQLIIVKLCICWYFKDLWPVWVQSNPTSFPKFLFTTQIKSFMPSRWRQYVYLLHRIITQKNLSLHRHRNLKNLFFDLFNI